MLMRKKMDFQLGATIYMGFLQYSGFLSQPKGVHVR